MKIFIFDDCLYRDQIVKMRIDIYYTSINSWISVDSSQDKWSYRMMVYAKINIDIIEDSIK